MTPTIAAYFLLVLHCPLRIIEAIDRHIGLAIHEFLPKEKYSFGFWSEIRLQNWSEGLVARVEGNNYKWKRN